MSGTRWQVAIDVRFILKYFKAPTTLTSFSYQQGNHNTHLTFRHKYRRYNTERWHYWMYRGKDLEQVLSVAFKAL